LHKEVLRYWVPYCRTPWEIQNSIALTRIIWDLGDTFDAEPMLNDILEWHRKATKPTSDEERIDPEDGASYTWGEISRYYANDLDACDLEAYWEKMTPVKANGADRSSDASAKKELCQDAI